MVMGSQSTDIDTCIEQLRKGATLAEAVVKDICDKTKEVLEGEPNVHVVAPPVTVVGDLHGQFYDLLELFRVAGDLPRTNYLFLGDYTNVGHFGVETVCLLLCLKLRYPSRLIMLRGNNDCRPLTQVYGFYQECLRKYGNPLVWSYICEVFDCMSVAAVIEGKIFCVHGGLAENAMSIDQIRVLDRFGEIPKEGPLCDMLWADPDASHESFVASSRGVGKTFGHETIRQFNRVNKIDLIVRTHQCCPDGFQETMKNMVTTVWSAPNYQNTQNTAAVLEVYDHYTSHSYNTFDAAPDGWRHFPVPDPGFEVPRGIPEYYH
eukprot:TRINITY_DN17261_c0_g1_i1.p1 TRINITY_DN17261_c0_g1~~TRINITY_DN17261_c0_g1_i1.p1  ORF type:complete len:340 (-),score=80.58 TRINITY_DN17261_c0_g1_i1:80-1036(-)